MRNRSLVSFALLAVTSLVALGCGADSVVSPDAHAPTAVPTAPSKSLLGGLLGAPVRVTALERNTPLAAPVTVSARIGVLGGVMIIPQAGLTVIVPPLAVSSPTNFSVTALAGSDVAYTFEPHGTQFLVPLVAAQDLSNTQAGAGGSIDPLSLFAGYFPNSDDVTSVTQLLNVNVNVLSQLAVFTIPHFSGYILATGRSGAE